MNERGLLLETICILCPNGCALQLYKGNDGQFIIEGNRCKKGIQYAIEEFENPKRMVCSTVKTTFKKRPRLSVKTNRPVPKEEIFHVMTEINQIEISHKVQCGDILLENVCNLGISIVATDTISEEGV